MSKNKSYKHRQQQRVENADLVNAGGGLAQAVLGANYGFPFAASGFGAQITQPDTLFKNTRWYLVSNMRPLLSQAYAEKGLIQTVIDVPVEDALRGGIDISSEQLDAENLKELQNKIEREGDLRTYAQAQKWKRLYGGAGMIVVTGNPEEIPLDAEKEIQKGALLGFRSVDMWELYPEIQWNGHYAIAKDPLDDYETFSFNNNKIHRSRIIRMNGIQPPSALRPMVKGWGLSVVEGIVDSINQYLKSNHLAFEVLDEFKLDIFRFKGLANSLMSDKGFVAAQKRIALANQTKSYENAIAMDAEDSFDQKELSFTGLAEVMNGIRLQIASDLRMPITKLFGISAAGFSTGAEDIENYNAMIESNIRTQAKLDILRMVQLRCLQLFGMIPSDLVISFKPLRVLSDEQIEAIKEKKFNRLLQAATAGLITVKEFKEACNKDQLFGISLDTSIDKIDMGEDENDDGEEEGESDE